jgi:hypothetical protein
MFAMCESLVHFGLHYLAIDAPILQKVKPTFGNQKLLDLFGEVEANTGNRRLHTALNLHLLHSVLPSAHMLKRCMLMR